ncbi:hypothetical protein BST81_04280 [Leptolyngbya sp. 'hensonii']|uniref:peptidoglycan-binding protein n=1 Tax=Leptolyngbya sp. 'hensonii' TaxID=1922337 RepID=UPI00094FD290|nr:peptidoglycan-binding protein [Leptolyngbya sp. 'hensonii']OLP19757.1 hypothetical protein BST81_04280 [Leptolyngbya sp. 'hensonii']
METLAYIHSHILYESSSLSPDIPATSSQRHRVWAIAAALTVLLNPLSQAKATVRYGDRSPTVRQVQQALVHLGFNPGEIDGIFGPQTEAAVLRFQRVQGLPQDGNINSETAHALGLGNLEHPTSNLPSNQDCPLNRERDFPGAAPCSNGMSGRDNLSGRAEFLIEKRSTERYTASFDGAYDRRPGFAPVQPENLSPDLGESLPESDPPIRRAQPEGRWQMAQVITQSGRLRIRSGPGTNYSVIGHLERGTIVKVAIDETEPDWVRLPQGGWVASRHILLTGRPDPDRVLL